MYFENEKYVYKNRVNIKYNTSLNLKIRSLLLKLDKYDN